MNWHSSEERAEEKWIIVRCTSGKDIQYFTIEHIEIRILQGVISRQSLDMGEGCKVEWAYIEEPER